MSRITNSDISTVGKVAASVDIFYPNDAQKRLKIQFWRKWNLGPVRSTDDISAAAVAQLTDSSTVEVWWKEKGFKEWFINEHSFAEDAERNAQLALETMRELMTSTNENVRLKAASESLKLKNELDKQAAAKEAEDAPMDSDTLQKLLNQAVAAGIVKLPEGPR